MVVLKGKQNKVHSEISEMKCTEDLKKSLPRPKFLFLFIQFPLICTYREANWQVNLWKMNEVFGCFKLDPTYIT